MRSLRGRLAVGLALCGTAFVMAQTPADKPAEALYLKLGNVGLDPDRVYKVRGASLDRSSVHITLEDGLIGFTEDVMGRVTGAFFEGDGEVLLVPPTDVERRSMSSFTGAAILEERFSSAYFRFNDNVPVEMQAGLRAGEEQKEFVDRWNETAKNLAKADAMRLLVTFSEMLPMAGQTVGTALPGDRFLHARLHGTKLGVFDVLYDSQAAEQIQAGQGRTADSGGTYYDVWTSFTPNAAGKPGEPPVDAEDWVKIRRHTIRTEVRPPKQIHADARMQVEVQEGGRRAVLFELSRFLQVESVKLNGQPVEFIHNPAVEGTALSRQGNDIVAVILPAPARSGEKFDLEFVYGGEVLAEAGNGLMYVGERGNWYPNRGLTMSDFDLEFDYPPGWTLVATGKSAPLADDAPARANEEQAARYVSERPMPLAGFNLGKYKVAMAQAGNVSVETYATTEVERDFPQAKAQVVEPELTNPLSRGASVMAPSRPSPAQNEATVGQAAARAIQYYSQRFGPYPYSELALTQMPGRSSQGWPGLIFLSSYAFLTQQQREDLHFEPFRILIQQSIPAHETAHQWWGDLVSWATYRDQWYSEGLANYCALMMLQEKDQAGFRDVMNHYRLDLLTPNKDGMAPKDAGPVTLGLRLLSSRFPEGYEAISYGRATWLFHMLRSMLADAERSGTAGKSNSEEPFVRALRKLRNRYEGKTISTRELMDGFAEELPASLRYEGKKSLDWFLEGWVNGTSLPRLELKGVKFAAKGTGSVVTGTILQKDAPRDLVTSVPVYGVSAGKSMVLLGRVFADGDESTFHVTAPAGVHRIVLDPYETVLTGLK